MRLYPIALAVVTAGIVLSQNACTTATVQTAPNLAVPITAAKVEQKSMPVEIHAIGTGEAYSTVSIEAQVNAIVQEVHFKEGQDVHKGDLLFTLDPRPFEAALQGAEGKLAHDRATAENSSIQASRYAKLYADGVASKEQTDQFDSSAAGDRAAVRADESAVEAARLELQYCSIYSPIYGRTGSLLVHAGNLVKQNDVPVMVVINQVTPIYVDFSIAEQHLGEVRRFMAEGRLPVQATPQDGSLKAEYGTLSFVDNAVDKTTGTIKLKGIFPNASRRLWPGQFDDVTLRLSEQANSIVVPSQAIQTGQSSQFVFVVKPDMTVEQRNVSVERTAGAETIVAKGLVPGETVVTDGQVRLIPGTKVQIKAEGTAQ